MHVSQRLLTLGLFTTLGLGLPRVSPALAEEPHQLVQSSVNRAFEPIDIRGRLDETSNVADNGKYFNVYPLEGTEGQRLVIDLISDDFDSYLLLTSASDEVVLIAEDSSGGENTNARIVVVLPRTGSYNIVTTSAQGQEIGNYRLTVQTATSSDLEQAELLEEANRLNQQVIRLYREDNYQEAIPLAQQALEIRETALGESHPDVATSLHDLAQLYYFQGNYNAAEPLYRRSLEIREVALGESHPDVATTLNNLAGLYRNQGNYNAAEPLYHRSLEILETALGKSHPSVARSLNNLAELYRDQGNYSAAEPLYRRSLEIQEVALGESHPDVATSLNNLALLYHSQGNYNPAETLFLRSLEIRETALGGSHPLVAQSFNNLALLYHSQGNYNAAEPLYRRSLEIRETALGESHPLVAASLSNLAELYRNQGNYNAAEPLHRRSLEIQEVALGESHPDVAQSLNNLALLYQAQGNYNAAELLYRRSLDILETALGEFHILVATSLNNLAALYHSQGNYNAAEPLYRRSLDILETALGGTHPGVGLGLNNLAALYHPQGNYNAAEPLYRRSLDILETTLGESHPSVAQTLNNLAGFYQAQGDTSQSLSFLQRGLEIQETNLALNLAIGSEARKQAYIATLTGTTHATVSLHLQDASDHPEAARLALTTVLRRKGRILDAVTETQQLLRDNLSPELAPLLDDYTNAQTQLATRLYAGLGNQDPDVYRSEIDTLRQQVEQLEDDLSRRSAEFRVATEPVEIEAVQALIPADAALVELVQYRPWSQGWGTPRYAAYVLHASGDPQWVDLGDAETIDNAAFAFLNATRVPNSEQRVQTTGRQLDELLMAPIRPLLGEATHLLLSPDSQLNLIPFAALVDEENRYLVESYQLTHLTTGRDLLRLQYPRPSRQPPVLFANPDYDDADTSAVTQ
ncbi:MAG: tetratricopeptide repeat protein, partial [Phormidium sp. BM_Day4_Bin.17]|nr:tetratricopeptide repeat protein [Phormidium sp. BM_Day4_Bin.17]